MTVAVPCHGVRRRQSQRKSLGNSDSMKFYPKKFCIPYFNNNFLYFDVVGSDGSLTMKSGFLSADASDFSEGATRLSEGETGTSEGGTGTSEDETGLHESSTGVSADVTEAEMNFGE